MDTGCENCEWEKAEASKYTTPVFKGMVAMMEPKESWVARWQRQEGKKKGIYALAVAGKLPEDSADEAEEAADGDRDGEDDDS